MKTTGCQRVLALLSDGKPHLHLELYRLGVIAHSRISELRSRGYLIRCWRQGDDWIYQLEGTLTERDGSEGARPIETGPIEPVASRSVSVFERSSLPANGVGDVPRLVADAESEAHKLARPEPSTDDTDAPSVTSHQLSIFGQAAA